MPLAPDDHDLLRRLAEGDEGALGALFERWRGPLFRFALRMSGSPALAEDVVQETFLALIHGTARYEPARGAAAPWLFGVARKQVLRRLERDGRLVALEEDVEAPSPEGDVLERLERARDAEAVWTALLAVPAPYREAVVLCDLQGLPYEEAAAALGCPVGTVRSRLHRARGMLARRLEAGRLGAARAAQRGVGR